MKRLRALVVRCPDWDESDSFEPVVAAVTEHAAGAEILRPGALALAARGPASYYGGEEAAGERLVDAVAAVHEGECLVGIADGLFAAWLAARRCAVVPAGGTAAFLRDIDIGVIGRGDLVAVLRRLGIYTLGAFAALPSADVADRFGTEAVFAQRLARGEDTRPPVPRAVPPDLSVAIDCDPPLERVDVAAFTARALAIQLHRLLDAHGLAASRLVIDADTPEGAGVRRVWRHDGTLSADAITDRVRWQLEGWLTAGPAVNSGVSALCLTPEGLMPQTQAQPGLWGDSGPTESRASRALVRVQGMLGGEAVRTAVAAGGRGLSERVRLVPWGSVRESHRDSGAPWPGALPPPTPTVTPAEPEPVRVLDRDGGAVGVTGRHLLTAAPASVSYGQCELMTVEAWAGPWAVSERWWSEKARRYARLQVRLSDDSALLLQILDGQWWVEGRYD